MWAEGCRSRAGEVGLCAGVAGREEHDLAPGVTWGWCPELPGRALRERDQMTPDPSPGLREVRGQEGENGLRTGVVSTLPDSLSCQNQTLSSLTTVETE